ncbi:UDP-glucose 4-epimerase GalE [Actinophytocola sp.]|uniref:UDP-glucose 4-epimerase GalE n=1 Tax=Actinophytocola sp. TaxID=1872138 RepID=UPI002ED5A08C
MTWLVVGGAGYIGAHVVRRLCAAGRRVVVLDDLSTGIQARVPPEVPLTIASVLDPHAVRAVLVEHGVDGVIHLAGAKSAPESVTDPLRYYQQNLAALQVLIGAMVELGVSRMVLSSSAAVYGVPQHRLVTEESPTRPINPYGETKLLSEWLLRSAGAAYGISWIALRYFNVVGSEDEVLADRGGTNLFPLVFGQIAAGRPVLVTGSDYPTRDGTGVRDYVHVADVADAHLAAIRRLDRCAAAEVYNVGTGRGHSVLEVLAAVREVTGMPVRCRVLPRRPGDAPEVVAGVAKIGQELLWEARNGLLDMVRSTWRTWLPMSAA